MKRIKQRLLSLAMTGALLLGFALPEAFAASAKSSNESNASETQETASEKSGKKQSKNKTTQSQSEEKSSKAKDETVESAKSSEDEADSGKSGKSEKKNASSQSETSGKKTELSNKEVSLSLSISKPSGLSASGGAWQVDPEKVSALTLSWKCKGDCDGFEVSVSGGVYSASTEKKSAKISVSGLSAGKYAATVKAIRDGKTVAKEKLTFQIIASPANESSQTPVSESIGNDGADESAIEPAQPEEGKPVDDEDTVATQPDSVDAEAGPEGQDTREESPSESAKEEIATDDAQNTSGEQAAEEAQDATEEQPAEEDQAAEEEEHAEQDQAAEEEQATEEDPAAEAEQPAEQDQAAEEQPAEEDQATEAAQPAEQDQAAEAQQHAEEEQVAEAQQHAEQAQTAEAEQPAEQAQAAEAEQPAEQAQAAEAEQHAEQDLAAEAQQPAEQEQAAEAEQPVADSRESTQDPSAEEAQEALAQPPVDQVQDAPSEQPGQKENDAAEDVLVEEENDAVIDQLAGEECLELSEPDIQTPQESSVELQAVAEESLPEVTVTVDIPDEPEIALPETDEVMDPGDPSSEEVLAEDGSISANAGDEKDKSDNKLTLSIMGAEGLSVVDGAVHVNPSQASAVTLVWSFGGACDEYAVSVSGGVYDKATKKKQLKLPVKRLSSGQYTVTVAANKDGKALSSARLSFIVDAADSEGATAGLAITVASPQGLLITEGVYQVDPAQADALTLAWQFGGECDAYNVSVSGDVYSGRTEEDTLTIPLSNLAAGTYTVSVVALNKSETVAQSQLSFNIPSQDEKAGDDPGKDGGQRSGGQRSGGQRSGGQRSGAAKDGEGQEADQGFHVTPGEALINTHTSGNRDMRLYGAVALTLDGESAMNVLTLGDTTLDIRLSDGALFTASIDGNTLALVPEDKAQAWLLNGYALKTLARSGVASLRLTLDDMTVEFPTLPDLSGSNYGALCASGRTSRDYSYSVSSNGCTVTVAGQSYLLTAEGELV